MEDYPSRFEHPTTLQLNSIAGATEGGGKGMSYPTPETTPLNGLSLLVPGMENPKTMYQDNNRNSALVVPTPSPWRPNNGRLQMIRQFSLPGTQSERERASRQISAPADTAPGNAG